MLVDTDILIDYFRGIPDAVEFIETHIDKISLSAISVAELFQGVRDGPEREALDEFISAVRVIDVDLSIATKAGLFRRQYVQSHRVGLADCLIAATALVYRLPMKTLNTKHFPMLDDAAAPYSKQ